MGRARRCLLQNRAERQKVLELLGWKLSQLKLEPVMRLGQVLGKARQALPTQGRGQGRDENGTLERGSGGDWGGVSDKHPQGRFHLRAPWQLCGEVALTARGSSSRSVTCPLKQTKARDVWEDKDKSINHLQPRLLLEKTKIKMLISVSPKVKGMKHLLRRKVKLTSSLG